MKRFARLKKGFGLLEVMAAAVVLGFLIVGLTRLQVGNREAVLRIRARDAAQIVAQQFIDSLSSIGINSIEIGANGDLPELTKDYEWQGKQNQTASNSGITSRITYTINAKIDDDQTITSIERSNLTKAMGADTVHTRARKVDLKVSWQFKGSSMQSINVSRVIK